MTKFTSVCYKEKYMYFFKPKYINPMYDDMYEFSAYILQGKMRREDYVTTM